MPLQRLKFQPGVNRESTTLANEGGWFECDKIRFRSGYPEKLGGWSADTGSYAGTLQPPSGQFWGIARSLWVWLTLDGMNLLGIGTHLKFQIQESIGGAVYDVTPIRATTAAGGATFAATNGVSTVTVTDVAHGATTNDFVTFSGAVSLGGAVTAAVLNAEFQLTVVDADTYTIDVGVTATGADTGNGGAAVVAEYQINTGNAVSTPSSGWGSGSWGSGSWGMTSTTSAAQNLRLWSQSNYGQDLIINPRGGALYLWEPSGSAGVYDRAVLLDPTSAAPYTTDVDCPSVAEFVMVSDLARIVIAFGCNDYGETDANPMLVRWSAQEDYATWAPAATNQAGSYPLSHGSRIVTALQERQEILVWTDSALYSMQYVGYPDVFNFQLLADNVSMIGPNAVATVNNMTFWMGVDKFYTYAGRVDTLPCMLRQYVFGDINMAQRYQFFAGTNEGFNEVWWFYCSAGSDTVDRYVVFNHLDRVWYYGTMERTAWIDAQLRTLPIACNSSGQIIYHESGVDDGTTNPPSAIESYIQSADFDIGDGHNYGFVNRIIPDVTFDGSEAEAPAVTFTVRPRQNPGAGYSAAASPTVTSTNNYAMERNYTVQRFTEIVYVRVRGRQMAFKVSSSGVGTHWQLGAPSIDIRADGRRS